MLVQEKKIEEVIFYESVPVVKVKVEQTHCHDGKKKTQVA